MDNQKENIEYQFNEYGWCYNPTIVFQMYEGKWYKCTIQVCRRYDKWFSDVENFNFHGHVFANQRLVQLGACYETEIQAVLAGIKKMKHYLNEVLVKDRYNLMVERSKYTDLKNEVNKFEQSILQPTLF